MNESAVSIRGREFQRDIFVWTTLHHFLPAVLLREMVVATIATLAPELTLEDIICDHLTGDGIADTWSVIPLPTDDNFQRSIQHHIRTLVWANDNYNTGPFSDLGNSEIKLIHLNHALQLGRLDFDVGPSTLTAFQIPENSDVVRLVEALSSKFNSENSQDRFDNIKNALKNLRLPVRILALKHFGDLSADSDDWHQAIELYQLAQDACGQESSHAWSKYIKDFGDIIIQSLASAIEMIRGADEAYEQINISNLRSPSANKRLLVINASHDAVVYGMNADDIRISYDYRSATLLPPLLLSSHDVGPAVKSWHINEYDQAYRYFWGVLRRQTALGSSSDSKATKALYACALLAQVQHGSKKSDSDALFKLSMRLLIEAESLKIVEQLDFAPDVVERHVSGKFVRTLVSSVDRYQGVRYRRNLVFVELITKWIEVLPRHSNKLTSLLMKELIFRAASFTENFHANKNVGGQGLRNLIRLARKRSDLRRPFGSQISELIVTKIQSHGWWTGPADALQLATLYIDALDAVALKKIVWTVLQLLRNNPSREIMGPIIEPAMQLLASEEAFQVVKDDNNVSNGYFSFLLTYGVVHRSAAIELLFCLSRFDEAPIQTQDDQFALMQIVEDVRAGAQVRNSSNVTDYIRAILVAAHFVGRKIVLEAIESLEQILRSPQEERSVVAFPYAFGPVIDIMNSTGRLVRCGFSTEDVSIIMSKVCNSLQIAWDAIAQRPELLAGFSIPPKRYPNPVLVYNWAYATRRLITEAEAGQGLRASFERASLVPILASAMQRGALSSATTDHLDKDEIQSITQEPADVFYAAIGRRLKIAEALPNPDKIDLLQKMLDRCIELGPHDLDLPVLMLAAQFKNELEIKIDNSEYLDRLYSMSSLYSNLGPYLQQWGRQ